LLFSPLELAQARHLLLTSTRYIAHFVDDELLNLSAVPKLLESAFDAIIEIASGGTVVKAEPLLRQ